MAGLPYSIHDTSGLTDKASSKGSTLSGSYSSLGYGATSTPGPSFLNYSHGGYSYRRNSLSKSPLVGRKNGSSSGIGGLSIYSVNLHSDTALQSNLTSSSVSYNDLYKTRTSDSLTDLRQCTVSPDLRQGTISSDLIRHDDSRSPLNASNDSINQEFSNMRAKPKSSIENLNFSKPTTAWMSDSASYTNRPYSPSWTTHSTAQKTFTGLRSATPSPVHDQSRSLITRSFSNPVDFSVSSYLSSTPSYLSSNCDLTSSIIDKQWDNLPGCAASPAIVITTEEKKNSSVMDGKSNLYRSKSEKDTLRNFKTISPRSEALKSTTKLRKYLKNNDSLDLREGPTDFDTQKSPVASLIAESSNLSRSRSMSPTPLKAFSFQSMFENSEASVTDISQPIYSLNYNDNYPSTPDNNNIENKKPSSEPTVAWKEKKGGITPLCGDKPSSGKELRKSGSVPSNLDTYKNCPIEQMTTFNESPSMNLSETPRGRCNSLGLQSKPKTHIPSFEEFKQMKKLSDLRIKLVSPRKSESTQKKKNQNINSDLPNSELDEEVPKVFGSKSSENIGVDSKVTRRKSKEGLKTSRVLSKPEKEHKDKSEEKTDERNSRESSRDISQPKEKRSTSRTRLRRSEPVERFKSPFLTRKITKGSEKEIRERRKSTEKEQNDLIKSEENKALRRATSQDENKVEREVAKTERHHRRSGSDKRTKQNKEQEAGLARSCSDSKAADVKKKKQRQRRSIDDSTQEETQPPTRHASDREVRRNSSHGKSPRSDVSEESLPSSGRVTPSLHVTSSFEALNESTFQQGDVKRRGRKIRHRASTLSTDSGVGGAHDIEEPDKLLPGSTDIERVDSGVGSETNGRRVSCDSTTSTTCYDCSNYFEHKQQIIQHGSDYLCKKCNTKRITRKEAITEFIQTEVNYLEDIKVMHKEFYVAMENAGLLTPEQLKAVFINLQELIEVSETFSDCLQDSADNAADQDDYDYINISIGKIFLDNIRILFPAFEAYCVNQPTGAALLKSLESEKQLLRVFLEVSQNDNRAVRRQHLKSFLMVPVQRSMRYPLLLNRIYKSTPGWHEDKERLQEAQKRTEDFLEEVNVQSQGTSGTKLSVKRNGSFSTSIPSNLKAEIRKVAVESVCWNLETVHLVHMAQLMLGPGLEQIWQKMISTPRHVPVYAVLVCTGKVDRLSEIEANLPKNGMLFPHADGGQKAALVLIKEKAAGKCAVVRDPLQLEKCIVSSDTSDEFTITEMEGDTIDLKCENSEECDSWLMLVKHYSIPLGFWRCRRNALANIMINHTLKS
ncbi:uncharacterized protein [Antedon mediterranea]|uniref:uncharacterized protein n=1 Tax=Antedon mediterranea TaxID=105859 RepID=UPI003AF4B0CD